MAQIIKKVINWTSPNENTFAHWKISLRSWKGRPRISDEGLVSKIYKDPLHLSNAKTHNTIKKWARC